MYIGTLYTVHYMYMFETMHDSRHHMYLQVDSPPFPPVDASLLAELTAQLQAQFLRLGGDTLKARRGRRGEGEGAESKVETVQRKLSNVCSYLILSGLAEDERVSPVLQVLLLQAVEEGECERGDKEELRLLAKKEIVSAMIRPGMQQMMNVSCV